MLILNVFLTVDPELGLVRVNNRVCHVLAFLIRLGNNFEKHQCFLFFLFFLFTV